jgi:hypothetical protein
LRTVIGLLLFLLLLGITLSLPAVQTYLGQYATKQINKSYKTDISVDQVAISVFGGIKLKTVMIRDHKKDTLIYANRIKTNVLSFRQLYNGDLLFGDIRIDGMKFNMKRYKHEKESNFDKFIKLFETGKKATKKFRLDADNIYVTSGQFIVSDENLTKVKTLEFKKINAELNDFRILGPDIAAHIEKMSFHDSTGLYVKNLGADLVYTKTNIKLNNLDLLTENSMLQGDVVLSYAKADFKDFKNKVKFDVNIKKGALATNDIYYFYKELGRDRYFNFSSHVTGTLNNLKADNLRLLDNKNTQIIGDVVFQNLFGKTDQGFYMNGKFQKVTANYADLVGLLPEKLGKKLPTSLKKLGQFTLIGDAEISTTAIDADLFMTTSLGNIEADLVMTNINNIDNASYTGDIILDKFNLGAFLDNKNVGVVSLDVSVDGKGFSEIYLDTEFSGDIYKFRFQNYTYSNIVVNGNFRNKIFQGKVVANDPNLLLDFDGTVNLGKKDIIYDFHANVDYANLAKLGFIKNDSVSVFKGDVRMNVSGNTLDNLQGDIYITETSYQNKKDTYLFDDFAITSKFDTDRVRTITINSPDIIEGQIVGKFEFSQVRRMIENSVGSLYANYRPDKIKKGQFLRFNFSIYNKIIEIFYPGISVAANTVVSGNINSDNGEFKFNFNSPQIAAFETYFDNLRIDIDNKNPLYNAYIEVDSIRLKKYKISEFSMLNVTARDTLFVRTEFKGGTTNADYYNLDMYHTIDRDNNIIVGIDKSELKFKDYLWYLNEAENKKSRIVLDKTLKNFTFENIVMSHEDQKIEFEGLIRGKGTKDLNLTFDNIDLSKVTPVINRIKIEGKLDGQVSLRQNNNVYQPTSSLTVDGLNINDIPLGNLNVDISGNESFSKFNVNSVLENENVESFKATGDVTIAGKETLMDIGLRFNRFNLGTLNGLLGGEAISKIRGFVSGASSIGGSISDLDINGRLFVDDAAVTVPYLNVEYAMEARSIVDVTETQFIVRNTTITDTKFDSRGTLAGQIKHNKFADWQLDLTISSNRLLALDTPPSEDAAYYGTAFIDGTATIAGPTTGLFINVDARSEVGTDIKIPIGNTTSTGTSNYIHFLSPKEKYNLEKGIVEKTKSYNGLELKFDFDITEDAQIEVILDASTGHGMQGRGKGTLLFEINTLGKFNMWGDFQIYRGSYNFKYGGLIDKKFEVKKFSSIVWEGDPMRAVLNLEAVYKTTANPAVLLENPSVNKKVPVEVVIGVRGNLISPEPDFNINFPTVSSVLRSEIQYKLDDKDTRQTQALYLLSSGGFLSPEGVSQSDFAGNLFERASGLFNDLFQDEDGVFQVGVDYVAADKRPGTETDGRFGFTVSTQINERITINGKVGVPVGGINESAIVGDVEVQYRVNEDGTLNLRVFNRENDINYIGEGIGYTQGIGITYEVDFDTFKELVNKIFKNQKLERTKNAEALPDSEAVPDYLTPEEKKKAVPDVKINQEAIPEEGYVPSE